MLLTRFCVISFNNFFSLSFVAFRMLFLGFTIHHCSCFVFPIAFFSSNTFRNRSHCLDVLNALRGCVCVIVFAADTLAAKIVSRNIVCEAGKVAESLSRTMWTKARGKICVSPLFGDNFIFGRHCCRFFIHWVPQLTTTITASHKPFKNEKKRGKLIYQK